MADWITPREWVVGEAISATKLNEISESLNYIHEKPKSVVTIYGSGTDLTTGSTTYVAVDDAQFTLSLEVQAGEDVRLWLTLVHTNATTGTLNDYDVIIDDTTYVSANIGTPLTQGIIRGRIAAGAVNQSNNAYLVISGLSAGVHTFKLRWKTSASTAKLILSGAYFQFGVQVN